MGILNRGFIAMTDKQLIKFVTAFRKGNLGKRKDSGSMCFAVCAPLQSLLALSGVETELTEGTVDLFEGASTNHFWLTLPDGRVLDPTADQYGLKAVYLGEPQSIHASPNGGLGVRLR
jgi:hypothetical protein